MVENKILNNFFKGVKPQIPLIITVTTIYKSRERETGGAQPL